MASFNRSVSQFAATLAAESQKNLALPDKNYDTGDFTPAGKYRLNDETHAFWLHKLAARNFIGVTPEIKQELLSFYKDPAAPNHTKQTPKEWQQTLDELAQLKR